MAKVGRFIVLSVVTILIGSVENARAQNLDSASSRVLIDLVYRGLLQRSPDQGGSQMWSTRLAQGGRQELPVIAGLIAGDAGGEFRKLLLNPSVGYETSVEKMYLEMLKRPSNSQGKSLWVSQLRGCADNLKCLQGVVQNFANAPDFKISIVDRVLNGEWTLPPTLPVPVQNDPKASVRLCVLAPVGESGGVVDPLRNADLLQACVDSSVAGDVIELDPGIYPMQKPIIITRSITLRTRGLANTKICGDDQQTPVACAHLKAISPLQNVQRAFIQVQSSNVTLTQIFIDGNKAARTTSPEAAGCRAGNNGFGMNMHVNASGFKFISSSTANALCGSGIEITSVGKFLDIEKSWVGNNGYHDQNMLWADGVTIHDSESAIVRDNVFVGNTDVDLIFGGCIRCTISGNQILHVNDFAQSAFAALMIHAWPNSTSGDYTQSQITGNRIDCGSKRCGFGLLIGAKPWYTAPAFGGIVENNSINGAQGGFIINDVTGPMTIGKNTVTQSGGTFNTSAGKRKLPAYGISQASQSYVKFTSDAGQEPWVKGDFTGAIANWWK